MSIWLGSFAFGFALYGAVILFRVPMGRDELSLEVERAQAYGLPLSQVGLRTGPKPYDIDNAAIALKQAAELAKAMKISEGIREVERAILSRDPALARAHLAFYNNILEALETAASKKGIDFSRDFDLGLAVSFTDYQYVREACRTLSARARVRALDGDVDLALDDLNRLKRIAALVSQEWGSVAQSVAILIDRQRITTTSRMASTWRNDAAALQRLYATTEEPLFLPSLERALTGQAYLILASLRNRESAELLASLTRPEADLGAPTKAPIRNGLPRGPIERVWLKNSLDAYADAMESLRESKDDEARIAALRAQDDRIRRNQTANFRFAQKAWPSSAPLMESVVSLKIARVVGAAYVAILQFQAEHGRLPGSLKEAAFDRQDPYCGGALLYKRTESGFTVYSKGLDKKDGGGQFRPDPKTPSTPRDIVATFPPPNRQL